MEDFWQCYSLEKIWEPQCQWKMLSNELDVLVTQKCQVCSYSWNTEWEGHVSSPKWPHYSQFICGEDPFPHILSLSFCPLNRSLAWCCYWLFTRLSLVSKWNSNRLTCKFAKDEEIQTGKESYFGDLSKCLSKYHQVSLADTKKDVVAMHTPCPHRSRYCSRELRLTPPSSLFVQLVWGCPSSFCFQPFLHIISFRSTFSNKVFVSPEPNENALRSFQSLPKPLNSPSDNTAVPSMKFSQAGWDGLQSSIN